MADGKQHRIEQASARAWISGFAARWPAQGHAGNHESRGSQQRDHGALTRPGEHMAASALFVWEGTDKQGRRAKGEITSSNPAIAKAELRKQGINATRVRKKGAGLSLGGGGEHQLGRHLVVHAPDGDDDARRRAAGAVVRDRRRRCRQSQSCATWCWRFDPMSLPETRLRRRCANIRCISTICSATSSMPANSPVRSKRCWTASRPTRKRPKA